LDNAIEKELLERLKRGTYGEMYKFSDKSIDNVARRMDEDEEEEMEDEEEIEYEVEKNDERQFVEDFEESDEEEDGEEEGKGRAEMDIEDF